ncbi:MAG: hypothetical protein SFU21_03590 [Flavihumibacter sp.]|nr:hypothetical protein [Flavihumibacter sp.]
MNSIAYILYLAVTWLITVHVGWGLYKNGRIYILNLLQGNEMLTDAINRILLTGYYLLNLGYATLMITQWQTIQNWQQLINSICGMVGSILLTLAAIHFVNMLVIYWLGKKNNSTNSLT